MKKNRIISLILVLLFISSFWVSPLAAENYIIKTISACFPNSAGKQCSFRVFDSADNICFIDEKKTDSSGNVEFEVAFENVTATYRYIMRTSTDESEQGEIVVNAIEMQKPTDAYYVLDEDFSMPRTGDTEDFSRCAWDLLEGQWTKDLSTSNIYFGGLNGIWLIDNSSSDSVVARRTFEELDNSFVIAEMRLGITNPSNDGWGFGLYSGDKEVIKADVRNKGLYFGDKRVCVYSANQTVGLRLEIDFASMTYDVFVNGNKAAELLPLQGGAIDNIRFFTSKLGTGRLYTGPVRIAKDYHIADEFVPYTTGTSFGENGRWKTEGNVSVISSVGTPVSDVYSLCLSDTLTSGKSSVGQTLRKAITGDEVITFKAYSPNKQINMLNVTAGNLKLKIESNKLYLKNENGVYDYVSNVPGNIWNTFRLTVNYLNGKCTVQVNGKEKAYNKKFAQANGSMDAIAFSTGVSEKDTIWLDDIHVFDNPSIPSDYPSTPSKLQKSANDVIVGIQTCDLWHEGKHFGWDKIADYPKRIPYLGLYDDGSSEVKDWEIKWMVEHGIDYSIHCWYRPGNVGEPIKEPRNGYSIHDGYFNAKYKDKIKFAIAWENAGFRRSGNLSNADMLSDFKNNIVPFWCEYYFKDPGYLTLDNKIVLNIYDIQTLTDALGSNGITEAVEYLKNEVKKLGFDGIYLIGTTSSSSTDVLNRFKNSGYDAIYSYSHGESCYTVAKMQNEIMRQKENGIISYIPTIGMGRDDTPWNRKAGGFLTPSAVEQLANWVKNKYFPNGASGAELGDRMVVLDNWNEYGEGHFFMPSNLGGFGYLEAIGKVFGQPQHTDVRPKDTARLGHLYDQKRIEKVTPRDENYNVFDVLRDTPLKRWDFNGSREGFTVGSGVTLTALTDTLEIKLKRLGRIGSYYYTKDPSILSPNNLNIALTGREVIHIKYKTPLTEPNNLQVYFITNDATAYSEANSVKAFSPAAKGAYEDAYLDMSFNSNWSGTLKQLRIDPFGFGDDLKNDPGNFYIDYIEILSYNIGEYVPEEYRLECTGYMDNHQNILTDVPESQTDGYVEFTYTNPYSEIPCMAFVAEYKDGYLVSVNFSSSNALITGTSGITLPIRYTPGHSYKAGVWNTELSPLIDVQKLGE